MGVRDGRHDRPLLTDTMDLALPRTVGPKLTLKKWKTTPWTMVAMTTSLDWNE